MKGSQKMNTVSRRQFIKLVGAGAIASAAQSLTINDIAEAAISRPLPLGTPILVVVTLYGGNDGLNTVVPVTDPAYQKLRPQLAYTEQQVLSIGEDLYLNGAMSGMKYLWDKNQLAIVRGVGYPQSDRSHFTSMAIWQSASLTPVKTGWLGRWVETQKQDAFLAISLGSVLPPLLAGTRRSGSVLPLGGLKSPTGTLADDCSRLSIASANDDRLTALAARSLRDLFEVSAEITTVLNQPAPASSDLPTIVGGNAGGDSNLIAQLDIVAKLIAAGSPTKVWSVSLGGFDTHADENTAQARLLGAVSYSLSRFMSQMRSIDRGRDVTVLVYSEFGRRVRANASQGTDHGTSGPVFVMGERVKGGFYGEQPALNKLKDDDLSVTTDFRDIYSGLLEDVLRTDATKVISDWSSKLTMFK